MHTSLKLAENMVMLKQKSHSYNNTCEVHFNFIIFTCNSCTLILLLLTSFWCCIDFVSYSLLVKDFIGGGMVVSSYDLVSEPVLKIEIYFVENQFNFGLGLIFLPYSGNIHPITVGF